MSFSMPKPEIIELDRVEIAVEPWSWEFTSARRAAIDRHFASRQRERPALWNGRVLLVHHYAIGGGVLRGACFETDYASFLAWRDWDLPDAGVFNVFAAAALQAADGAYLLGEMAPSTAAAGQLYFPCGRRTPRTLPPAARSILPAASPASFWRKPASTSPHSMPRRAGA